MKKIIVAISMLLIATLALSVAAFGAPSDYGVATYYLGNPVMYSPVVDGTFGASEYVVSYNLTNAAVYLDSSNKVLEVPADSSAVTSNIRVGLSYDVDNIYVALQASLAASVSDVIYTVEINDGTTTYSYTLSPSFDDSTVSYKSESTLTGTLFSGELAIANNSITVNGHVGTGDPTYAVKDTYSLKITELTKNTKGAELNKSIWNAVKLTSIQKLELNTIENYLVHNFILGNPASANPAVSVSQEAVGVPTTEPVTTEAVTTEAATTEEITTEAATTEEITTEAATTEEITTEAPATDAPTEAPTTEIPVINEPKGNCKNSIGMMGIALVAALGTCAVVATKKKED